MNIFDSDFLTWVKTKDPRETYDWRHPYNCPIAQFLEFQGLSEPHVYPWGNWSAKDEKKDPVRGSVSSHIARAVKNYPLEEYLPENEEVFLNSWTFGQLAARLEYA